jgi:hypothetical protein
MSINQSTYNCPAGRRFNLDRHQIGMSDFLRRNPHAGCAVNTWITARAGKGKAILHNIDRGEGTAMGGQSCAGYRMALLSGPRRGMHVMTATRGS